MTDKSHPCEFCDSVDGLENRLVTVYRHRGPEHFIFEQVSARVCKGCGHRYFAWDVAEEMERLMDAPESRQHTQPVPVISLAAR